MRTAAPRQWLDDDATLLPESAAFARALLIAAMIGALPWHSAAAQDAPACAGIQDDAERLACYDRREPAEPRAPAAPPAPPVHAPAPSAAEAAAPEIKSTEARRESATPVAPAAADADDDGIIPIVIVAMRALPGRETVFTAKDGATWVQTDTRRVAGLPEPPFEAELKPGSLGSYFLVPKEHGRAIRVRAGDR